MLGASGARNRQGDTASIAPAVSGRPRASRRRDVSLPCGASGLTPLATGFRARTGRPAIRKARTRAQVRYVLPRPVPVAVTKTGGMALPSEDARADEVGEP